MSNLCHNGKRAMHEKKNTILVVDDEAQIRKMLRIFLDASDFKIEESDSGKQAIRMAVSVKPNLVLLDLGLPDMDGKDVIREIRQWSQVPIIVLSVRAVDEEVVAALDAEADDYIIKPFNADVLVARIRANLRKAIVQEAGETELLNGHVRIDLLRHEVFVHGQKTALTPKEYDLLRYFMINRGRMLTHKQILSEIWGAAHANDTQYLRVYVGQMREKLGTSASSSQLIVTEPGVGYRMECISDAQQPSEAA
jgi:two-component system KDP operon response regulator KdpE